MAVTLIFLWLAWDQLAGGAAGCVGAIAEPDTLGSITGPAGGSAGPRDPTNDAAAPRPDDALAPPPPARGFSVNVDPASKSAGP